MNIFDSESTEAVKYTWLMGVALIGGIIGYFRKQAEKDKGKSLLQKLCSAFLSVITSMFVAYIVYEILMYLTEAPSLSVAIAGLASFAGTDLLVAFEEAAVSGFVESFKNFFKRIFGGK